ncbi:MAG: hypothetical protein IKX67_09705, partial [Bacteroidales bacterium]|nr:hypothetical protein [Bacteroidales bacterium]
GCSLAADYGLRPIAPASLRLRAPPTHGCVGAGGLQPERGPEIVREGVPEIVLESSPVPGTIIVQESLLWKGLASFTGRVLRAFRRCCRG